MRAFRTFRAIFATVSVVSLAVIFTACPGGTDPEEKDITPPVISVPVDPEIPIVDLGDKIAVLKDITARDDVDGDVTTSIKVISDVETVGLDTIRFEVSDKAGNRATATRVVMVSAAKLAGQYDVFYKEKGGDNEYQFMNGFVVTENAAIRLRATGFHNKPYTITLSGDGTRQLKIEEHSDYDHGAVIYILSGEITFEKGENGKYDLKTIEYKYTPESPVYGTEYYTARCVRLQ